MDCEAGREPGDQRLRAQVKKKDYDIIFMDHMMPEMDGVDAARFIRTMDDGKYKDIVIIALTANAVNEARELFAKELCLQNTILINLLNRG